MGNSFIQCGIYCISNFICLISVIFLRDVTPGFEDHLYPNHVFKLKKALYGLKQAPQQWYERLNNFLLSKGYARCAIDKALFIRKHASDVILVQV